MIRKKILVIISFILAIIYHLILYIDTYGIPLGKAVTTANAFLALGSCLLLLFIYITTKWRVDFRGSGVLYLYDLMILYLLICYFRSFLNVYKVYEMKEMLFSPFVGLSLFPVLFLIIGINPKYFYMINKILFLYCLIAFFLSLPLISFFELQFFLMIPLFYIIVTFPLQTPRNRLLTLIITVVIFLTSLTNRAGVLRLAMSYLIIILYYIVVKARVSKKIINFIIFIVLITPFYLFYLGITGKDVFKMVLGENQETGYAQDNLRSDTRTFLYVDVLRDLKINRAFLFGKGTNAGYVSDDFETFSRTAVEVGFLQILLKSGVVGFLLYMSLIITAIYKAINKSENLFMQYLGMLLSVYVLMFFLENIIGFTLFNIVVWSVVGMCHSSELRGLNDKEIQALFLNAGEPA